MGGSPGLVVMGDDSCLRGHGFESRRRILDGHLKKSYLALHDAQAGSRTGDIHSSYELLNRSVPYLRKGPFTLPSCGVRKTVECGEKI